MSARPLSSLTLLPSSDGRRLRSAARVWRMLVKQLINSYSTFQMWYRRLFTISICNLPLLTVLAFIYPPLSSPATDDHQTSSCATFVNSSWPLTPPPLSHSLNYPCTPPPRAATWFTDGGMHAGLELIYSKSGLLFNGGAESLCGLVVSQPRSLKAYHLNARCACGGCNI